MPNERLQAIERGILAVMENSDQIMELLVSHDRQLQTLADITTGHGQQMQVLTDLTTRHNQQMQVMMDLTTRHSQEMTLLAELAINHDQVIRELQESNQELRASNARQERLFDYLLWRDGQRGKPGAE
jgi:hypothetical protein